MCKKRNSALQLYLCLQEVHAQRRAGSEIEVRDARRRVAAGEEHAAVKVEIWRHPAARDEIPLQHRRNDRQTIRRAARLEHPENRRDVHAASRSGRAKSWGRAAPSAPIRSASRRSRRRCSRIPPAMLGPPPLQISISCPPFAGPASEPASGLAPRSRALASVLALGAWIARAPPKRKTTSRQQLPPGSSST